MIEIQNRYHDIGDRRGIIYMNDDYFTKLDRYYEMMSVLFSKFFPQRVEVAHDTFGYKYYGYCIEFEPTPVGMIIPVYNVVWDSIAKTITFENAEEAYNIYHSTEILPDRLFTIQGE